MAPLVSYAKATPVRQDIATFAQDATKLAKFEAAIKEMQDRSKINANDPKGWLVNAKAHTDFCSNVATNSKQVHFCYWFLTWHRAYLHVTELKLREISGDQSLSHPYWNWTTDRCIPAAYTRSGSPLAHPVRFTPNRPLQPAEIDLREDDPDLQKLGVAALSATQFEAAGPDDIAFAFGGIARPNIFNAYDKSRLEGTPHVAIHNYVGGGLSATKFGDMTDLNAAARDPIFFAHHANLDRLWEIWRQDPARKNTEPRTAAFLNHKFVFPWLDGTSIQVSESDTLDIRKFNYVYDNLQVLRPGAATLIAAQEAGNSLPPIATEKLQVPLFPQSDGPTERKILQITDVENPKGPITIGIYIKPDTAPAQDLGINVGSFAAGLNGGETAWPTKTLSFDITAAANKFAGQLLTVQLIPLRLRAEGAEEYPDLKYGAMRIIARK